MKTIDAVLLTIVATLFVLSAGWAVWSFGETSRPPVARCAEDAVLVGTGEYENGWWTEYECGPALDDFGG